jgi:hypothetical protein
VIFVRALPVLAVVGAVLVGCDTHAGPDEPHPSIPSKYSPGGEYSFVGRPTDPQPQFLVLHVDSHPSLGNIIHVAIRGIRLRTPSGVADHLQHFPIAEASLDGSGPKLIRANSPVPEFINAYMEWRKPFDQGKAGIWTKPLSDCLDGMEQGLNGGKK